MNNKILSGVIGLTVGDALGVPVQFTSRKELRKNPVIDMREYGTHYQPKGTWSDDTTLSLCLMISLIECKEINYIDIMERFRWWADMGKSSLQLNLL